MAKRKTRKKRGGGRPTKYTPELGRKICEELSMGLVKLGDVLARKGMPTYRTVMRWKHRYPEFRHMYERAREEQAEAGMDELVSIARDCPADRDEIQKARLLLDTMKFAIIKLKPRKYSERLQTELSGPEGGPVRFETNEKPPHQMTDDELAKEIEQLEAEQEERSSS